jgi:hypothetical protein
MQDTALLELAPLLRCKWTQKIIIFRNCREKSKRC